MKIKFLFLLIFSWMVFPLNLAAQNTQWADSLSFYGSVRAQLAYYNERTEVQNNGSRIGFYYSNRSNNGLQIFLNTEWAINIVNNDYTFNVSSVTDQGLEEIIVTESANAFSTRLGMIGISYKNLGTLSIGKQWSVYYDVSGWTDYFTVFGGEASGTYQFGTDGGNTGTGRAGKAMIYRNRFGRFSIGGQVQLLGGQTHYGGSITMDLFKNFEAGIASNHVEVPGQISEVIIDIYDTDVQALAGLRYKGTRVYAAAVYNYKGSDLIRITENDTSFYYAYQTDGIEFFTSGDINARLNLYGGFNYQIPKASNPYLSDDFRLSYAVIGAKYHFTPYASGYFECKFDNSIDAEGKNDFNVFILGIRMDFSRTITGIFTVPRIGGI